MQSCNPAPGVELIYKYLMGIKQCSFSAFTIIYIDENQIHVHIIGSHVTSLGM
jgi:hypothetical protein